MPNLPSLHLVVTMRTSQRIPTAAWMVGNIMIGDLLPVIAVDTPERDQRAHYVFGQIPSQAFIPRRHITLLYMGDEPVAISRVTGLHQTVDLFCLERLSKH